jgi:hypothetical protein
MGAPGTTPTIDVGAVKGNAELTFERKTIEVKAGSPQTLIEQYAIEELLNIKVTGIEWDFDNLAYVLGAGTTGGIGTYQETLELGGAMSVNNRALRYVHRTPDGGTIDLHIFKAQGVGKIAISLNEANMHEFPYEFKALEGITDFTNQALAASKKLFKIVRTKP